MSRLTRTDISMAIEILKHPDWGDESDVRTAVANAITGLKELQHYKDLEEQGRLIETIRCKDCKHFTLDNDNEHSGYCKYWDNYNSRFGYCSGAKLKELKGE